MPEDAATVNLVGWSRSSLHFLDTLFKRPSEPKPHENHKLAGVPLIPKFASKVLQVLANFGIGTLASDPFGIAVNE